MKLIKKIPEVIVDANMWTPETDTADDPVSLEREPHAGSDGKPILFGLLHTHNSQLRVNSGDWVLRFADGSLTVMNPKDLEEQYAPYDLAERVNTPKKLSKPAASE
jgi:hypothetical protein